MLFLCYAKRFWNTTITKTRTRRYLCYNTAAIQRQAFLCNTLQHTATHCNTHCNTLQHIATLCLILCHQEYLSTIFCNMRNMQIFFLCVCLILRYQGYSFTIFCSMRNLEIFFFKKKISIYIVKTISTQSQTSAKQYHEGTHTHTHTHIHIHIHIHIRIHMHTPAHNLFEYDFHKHAYRVAKIHRMP